MSDTTKRIGGRGCPSCGSHNTEVLGKSRASFCNSCNHRWQVCKPGCRGYRLDTDMLEIVGCPDCKVPNSIARRWPEAWRSMAKELDGLKLTSLK